MFTNKQELKDMVMIVKLPPIGGMLHLKMIFLASFIHPRVVTNLKKTVSSVEDKI